MGKRGPKPEPPALKLVKGNPGKRPPGKPPTGKAMTAAPPDWMNRYAKAEWRRLQRLLINQNLLLEKYRGNFEMLCHDYGMWKQCALVVAKQGITYEKNRYNSKGDVVSTEFVTRPEVLEGRKAQQQYYRRGAAFGLSPSDDGSLGLKVDKPDDEVADAMSKRPRRQARG
jgi:P27 family predicted phage terminase small subunit